MELTAYKRVYILISFILLANITLFAQNVGVSDASFTPQGLLHLYKSTAGPSSLFQLSNLTSGNGATNGLTFDFDASFNINFNNRQNTFLGFNTNGIERMRITNSGFVGINTINATGGVPGNMFHVFGGTGSTTQTIAAIEGNSLTTGKGLAISSSSITTGNLLDVQATNTTGASSSIYAINNSVSANAISVAGYGNPNYSALYAISTSSTNGTDFTAGNSNHAMYGVIYGSKNYSFGVYGQVANTSLNSAGAMGYFASNCYGMLGYYDGSGFKYGFYGLGSDYGVYGRSNGSAIASGSYYGIYGIADGTGGTTTTNYGFYGTASGGTTANYGVWGNASGTSGYGVYGYSASITDGAAGVFGYNGTTGANTGLGISQIRGGVIGRQSWGQSYHFGVAGYVFNDLASYPYGGVIGAATTSTNPTVWGALGYRESAAIEYGGFFNGNSRTTGYLLVGNPTAPLNTISSSYMSLYKFAYLSGTEAWSVDNICGSTKWYVITTGANSGMLYFDNSGTRARTHAYSPWIWIPAGSSSLGCEGVVYCNLEAGFDGVWIEYKASGGSWTKISAFDYGGYLSSANGSNTVCSGNDAQTCWNGISNTFFFRITSATVFPGGSAAYGNWVQFRFVGVEDGANATGEFDVKGFNVTCIAGASVGGAFTAGNIYAEKNVYAGSNALIGDVAEYFKVDVQTEPGDLIIMKSAVSNEYTISSDAYNSLVIGVHSTNPTVTLNQPIGVPVCLTGRVPIKVSGENGVIKIGDYITAASLKGYAMKADKSCFIVGRALENFEEKGNGKILCMMETGWYNPSNNNIQSGGSFFLQKDNSSVVVNDPAVKPQSRVFVIFRENPAAHYWISKVEYGSFSLNVGKLVDKDIPFDYFIDNAVALNTTDKKTLQSNDIEPKKDVKTSNANNNINEENIKHTLLPEYQGKMPPSSPPDIEQAWIWSTETGFKMTKDITALIKEQEKSSNQQLNSKDTKEKQENIKK